MLLDRVRQRWSTMPRLFNPRPPLAAAHRYLLAEWPSVLFAAAVVSILVEGTSFFRALDGYAWLVIGNLSAVESRGTEPPKVVVVHIDEEANATRYFDRSPLLRCQLQKDLKAVYEAKPSLVAIDLDLSPAAWLASPASEDERREAQCQEHLYQLIHREACGGISTVLMAPLDRVQLQPMRDRLACSGQSANRSRVWFGDPSLPEEYGLLLSYYAAQGHFARQVHHAYAPDAPEERQTAENPDKVRRIDVRRYLDGNGLTRMSVDSLNSKELAGRAVFFGAAFGEEDLFLTPLGYVYGVHAHAASFLSMLTPLGEANEWAQFMGELLLAVLFGMSINLMWDRYFSRRIGADPVWRQLAALHIVALSAILLVIVTFTIFLSLRLLSTLGVWLSPIPIAVGMLLDSFIVGSATRARHEMLRLAAIPIAEPKTMRESIANFFWRDCARLWNIKSQRFGLRLEDLAHLAQLARTEYITRQLGKSSNASERLQEKLAAFIEQRAQAPSPHTLTQYRVAAMLVALRRTAWAGIVVFGLITHFSG